MSLDIWLEVPSRCPSCGGALPRLDEPFEANYTHNVSGMWSEAGVYDALYMSHGKRAGDFVSVLRRGISDMQCNAELYKAMNPPNGWGDYLSALDFLRRVYVAFKANPDALIGVSK